MALGTLILAQGVPHMFDRDTTIERVVALIGLGANFQMQYDTERTPTTASPYIFNLGTQNVEQVVTVELGIRYPKGTVIVMTTVALNALIVLG